MPFNPEAVVESAEFRDFLIEAKQHGYGMPDVEIHKTESGAKSIEYRSGSLLYIDNFVGGNPYAGYEHVSYDTGKEYKPVWAMSYYETHIKNISGEKLRNFLGKVLAQPDPELPLRGPKEWQEDGMRYWMGLVSKDSSLKKFDIEEFVSIDGRGVYIAKFIGGLVNYHG